MGSIVPRNDLQLDLINQYFQLSLKERTYERKGDRMILLVGSQKGGPGKSTVATNLCVWLTKRARDVILVDADRQQTANNWATDREEDSSLKKINTSL